MAASTVTKTLYDGTITLEDGTTPTAVSLTVPFSVGDFTSDGLREAMRAVQAFQTRGVRHSIRKTTREFVTFSFSAQLADLSDGTDGTLADFMLKQGSYASNVSTTSTDGDVYTVNVILTVEGTDLGDAADHVLTLPDCDAVLSIAEGEPDTVSISGTVYGLPTMD